MSCLTHLGVPCCLLSPPLLGGLDVSPSHTSEKSAPKRRCVNDKAIEDTRRAMMSLKNVKAIQIQGDAAFYQRDCKLCYNFSGLQFSLADCETLSAFNNLQYLYFVTIQKVDLDCLLSNCKGIQYLSFRQCSVSLPVDISSFANIRQLHLYGEHNFDLTKFADTLASAVNLTHLCLAELPEVSVEEVCTLIQKVPSLVFLIIICRYPGSKSLTREINTKVNTFVKSIKRSYLEFHCCLNYEMLDNSDIDCLW